MGNLANPPDPPNPTTKKSRGKMKFNKFSKFDVEYQNTNFSDGLSPRPPPRLGIGWEPHYAGLPWVKAQPTWMD